MKLIETNLKCCANGTQNLTPFIVTPVQQVLSAATTHAMETIIFQDRINCHLLILLYSKRICMEVTQTWFKFLFDFKLDTDCINQIL